MKKTQINRRSFLKSSAALSAATAFNIIPAHAAPKSEGSKSGSKRPPSERLNLAIIGCTNRGGSIGEWAMSKGMANCVALCDV